MKRQRYALKLWNGRGYEVFRDYSRDCPNVYVAAYSIADARRVCIEAGLYDPGAYEITTYWNKGCWGNKMDKVIRTRGLWTCSDDPGEKPLRRSKRRPRCA